MCANISSREVVVVVLKNCGENHKEIINTLTQNIIFRKAKKITMFISDNFNSCTNVVRTLSSTFLEKSIIVFEGYHEALKYSMPDSKTILIIDGNGTKSAQKEASKG